MTSSYKDKTGEDVFIESLEKAINALNDKVDIRSDQLSGEIHGLRESIEKKYVDKNSLENTINTKIQAERERNQRLFAGIWVQKFVIWAFYTIAAITLAALVYTVAPNIRI